MCHSLPHPAPRAISIGRTVGSIFGLDNFLREWFKTENPQKQSPSTLKKKWRGGVRGWGGRERSLHKNKAPNHHMVISINALEWNHGKPLSGVYKLNIVYPSWVLTGLLLWCQSNSCSSCNCILPPSTGTCCGQGSQNPQRCNFLLITLAWLWQPAMQHSVGGDVDSIHN